MSKFIQIHTLTSQAPSNINRDDLGRPKTAKMGGLDRLRISSQSAKRSWRTSDIFQESLSENLGIRTRKFGETLLKHLVDKGASESKAKKIAQSIAGVFASLETNSVIAKQLTHISPEEQKAALNLCDELVADTCREPKREELDLLREQVKAVDIAMFGRMLASSPKYSVEAAVSVSHAITVNHVAVEDDYFTAVDDLNTNEEDSGSAHIGETGFGSGVFYQYICIDKDLLVENLGDEVLAKRAIRALTEAAATITPSGKQKSYASYARASYVLVEKGNQAPRQLSSAFLDPVKNSDMIKDAVNRLETLHTNMNNVYGNCSDSIYKINVEKGEGSFKELLDFVGA